MEIPGLAGIKRFASTLEVVELKIYKWAAAAFDYFREI